MHRTNLQRGLALLVSIVALTALAAPVAAAEPATESFHRLNPDPSNPAPEHERLVCIAGSRWVCGYSKQPEPELEFHWDRTIGVFVGADVTTSFVCPDWIPSDVCSGTQQVIGGRMTFIPDDAAPFQVQQQLILTDGDGIAPLYVHWIEGGFACPWYGTFADALAANPLPPQEDCFVAP